MLKYVTWAGEMAETLGAFMPLPGKLSLVPSTQVWWLVALHFIML